MASNRVVTYIDINLNSVDAYWGEIVAPTVQAFRTEPSPRSVFHAAHSVWHLHDWVWHERNPGQDSRGQASIRTAALCSRPALNWGGFATLPTQVSIGG